MKDNRLNHNGTVLFKLIPKKVNNLIQGREALRKIFNRVPTYGFGSAMELQKVFLDYLTFLVKLRKEEPWNMTVKGLIWKAHIIRTSIKLANSSLVAITKKEHFDRASNELSIDIEYLLGVRYHK